MFDAILFTMDIEVWAPVPRFLGLYEVSTLGRIRSLDKYINSRWPGHNRTVKGRILSTSPNEHGYIRPSLIDHNGVEKRYSLHRIVAEVFIPNPDNLPQVNHKDGDKANNKVSNLEWITCQANIIHAFKNNLKKGVDSEACHFSVLTKEDVLKIRELFASGVYTKSQLAKQYNVNYTNIRRIILRHIWKNI
jgi:hypothetical protein